MSRKSIIITIAVGILAVIAGMTLYMAQGGEDGIEKKLAIANQYITEEKYEEAVLAFQEIIDIDENSVEARVGLASAYTGLGEYDKAEEVLRRGLALDGAQTAYWDSLLELYKKAGKSDVEIQQLMQEAYEATGDEKYKPVEPMSEVITTISEVATEETTTTIQNQDLGDGMLPLDDPEKVITFQDLGFEQYVREAYGLGDREIRWKDVGYRTEMDAYINEKVNFTLKAADLKWFVNLHSLDLNYIGVSGDLSALSGLCDLVSGTSVGGDLVSLSGLGNLKYTHLGNTSVSGDLSSFSGLDELDCVRVENTNVTGTLTLSNGDVITAGN